MNNMDQLVRIAQNLTPYKVKALIMMADALQRNIDVSIDRNSDILSESFVEAFSTILLMHHATHIEKFNKKSFEYAFVLASREAGKVADIEVNSTFGDGSMPHARIVDHRARGHQGRRAE